MGYLRTPQVAQWQKFSFPRFIGGLVGNPRKDTDCLVFDNIEINSDGFANTRQGLQKAHTDGAFGLGETVGICNDPARGDGGPGVMVAKVGNTCYSASTQNFPFHTPVSFGTPEGYEMVNTNPVWFEFPTVAN